MKTIFNICVELMIIMSDMIGITYQQLNVLLFVILHPVITVFFIYLYIHQALKRLKLVFHAPIDSARSHLPIFSLPL